LQILYFRVKHYFNFSSFNVDFGNREKSRIYISGKLTFSRFLIYLFSCLFLSFPAIFSLPDIGFLTVSLDVGIPLSLLVIIAVLPIIIIRSKITFKRLEPRKTSLNFYQRKLPSKLRPAHVRMLIRDGLIDEYTLASTILDLVDKGYLELARCSSKEELFNNKEIIIRKTNKNINKLFLYEQFLINWFINVLGNETEISQSNLHKELLESKNASRMFKQFQSYVILSFPLEKYYQKRENKSYRRNVAIFVTAFVFSFVSYVALFFLCYILGKIMFVKPVYTLNTKGVEEGGAWLDLKRFLEDFSMMKTKTPEMVILWNHYLTYSMVLDIKSIASNQIKAFFGENIYKTIHTQELQENEIPKGLACSFETVAEIDENIKKINEEELKKYEIKLSL